MAGRETGPDAGGIASFVAERGMTVGNYIKNRSSCWENMLLFAPPDDLRAGPRSPDLRSCLSPRP
jgi:hypothetical protein